MTPQDELAAVIAQMPDEAFSYVVLACQTVVDRNLKNHGFTSASTEAFQRLAVTVNQILNPDRSDL